MAEKQTFRIWEGVFSDWSDAPQVGNAFNSEKWIADQVTHIDKKAIESTHYGTSPSTISRDYVLPMLVALSAQNGCRLRILDFGGGVGSEYLSVVGAVPASVSVEYHVLESSALVDRVGKRFAGYENLIFHSKMPEHVVNFDIIHAARSMQYVDDWRDLLKKFSRFNAEYIVLAGLLAGDIKPFVTLQNYYGCKIAVHFLNREEVIAELESLGYRLIFNSLHISKRLGKESPLPMEHFPVEHRLEHPCQLVFCRDNK